MSFPKRDENGNAFLAGPIYHYTSITGLKGIVDSGIFQATHPAYMSDATEIEYGVAQIRAAVDERKPGNTGEEEILEHLRRWLDGGMRAAHIFVMSFSEKRDDLNQWRSYTPTGQGVCIGFDSKTLVELSQKQGWDWSHCSYEKDDQRKWADAAITRLVKSAIDKGPNAGAQPSQKFDSAFYEEADTFLRVACRIKHPAFRDEWEWRFISPYIATYVDDRIGYRVGDSMLIPFARFSLGDIQKTPVISEVTVGPTAHPNLSINSIASYLSSRTKSPSIRASMVPYRPI